MSPSFLDRLLGRASAPTKAEQQPPAAGLTTASGTAASIERSGGFFDITDASARLEAVGESHYQEALAEAVGGWPRDYVTCEVVATLIAEPDNPFDENAIAVHVGARIVGYLARRDAMAYQRPFEHLRRTGYMGASCRAVICGGGTDRPSLGIFLRATDARSVENRVGVRETALPPVAQLVTNAAEPLEASARPSGHREPQTLWCEGGQHHWERAATRGRPPRSCPDHR